MFDIQLTGVEYSELFEVLSFTLENLDEDDTRTPVLENILTKMEDS